MGADRPLQVLDDSAQELHGAQWSVDNPDLAELQEHDGLMVLHAKGVGTVRVSATINGEMKFCEIKIWSALRPLPLGTTNWGLHPIGREVGDLPAVPTGDGPDVLSLEQTTGGDTYLRADMNDGVQVWTWLMPEKTHDVELICGDWLGGALISAAQSNSYTLYAVGKDGKLRWQHTSIGVRKSLAISTDHILYLLNQSPEGTATSLTAFDKAAGTNGSNSLCPPPRIGLSTSRRMALIHLHGDLSSYSRPHHREPGDGQHGRVRLHRLHSE